jgi:Glycosyl transferase family 2
VLATVLITNFNFARWLPAAIDSALAQTLPNVEVVVVDDGSTDGSRDVLRRYRSAITAVLKDNEGQAAAVNDGFAVSHGDVVCLLDSDDIFAAHKVERVVQAMRPQVSLIYHPLQSRDAEERPLGRPYPRSVLNGDISREVQRAGGFWPHALTSGLSFPREFLARVLPIPDLPASRFPQAHVKGSIPFLFPDSYLAGLAPFHGRVAGIAEPLGTQRLHGANTWTRPRVTDRSEFGRRRERVVLEHTVVVDALARAGIPFEMSLNDNLLMKQYTWAAGEDGSLAGVLASAARCPTLPWPMKWRELARIVLRRW